jgi:preprotein translocase subunit YajC
MYKKKRQYLLSANKKSDRVMTIGGIIGSVVSVNDAEVTLKVDESANVKITFIRSAIQRVLQDDERPRELN